MPRNSGIKTGECPVRFSSESLHTDQIFTLQQIFEKSWECGKDLFACFVDLEKAHDLVPRDSLEGFAQVRRWWFVVMHH